MREHTTTAANRCTLCREDAGAARLRWQYDCPPTHGTPSRPTKGVPDAHRVSLDLVLCPACAEASYKHLKRMVPRSVFEVTVAG
jgi:hypothetical protein